MRSAQHHDAAERHAVLQAQARAEVQAAQEQLEATIAGHRSRLTEVEDALRTAEARERKMAEQHEAEGGALRLALQQAQDDSARQVDELRTAIVTLETTLAEARTANDDRPLPIRATKPSGGGRSMKRSRRSSSSWRMRSASITTPRNATRCSRLRHGPRSRPRRSSSKPRLPGTSRA